MASPLIAGRADAVAGKVRIADEMQREWMQPFHRTALASTEAIETGTIKSIISANMGFKREVLNDVSGFDTELGPGAIGALEDVLFSWQLVQAGYRVMFVETACVTHHIQPHRLSRRSFLKHAEARGRSLAWIQYHWLHYSESKWTHRATSPPWQQWVRQPRVVLAKRFLDMKRFHLWPGHRDGAPVSAREFWATMNYFSILQYIHERNKNRKYNYMGLKKVK
jgi:GT2 family glycosyltransferase